MNETQIYDADELAERSTTEKTKREELARKIAEMKWEERL